MCTAGDLTALFRVKRLCCAARSRNMITNGVGAMIRKEGVFQVTMMRSPPEPVEGHKKTSKRF
jgi:hypothetical protein